MKTGEALVEGAALLRSTGADSPSLDASLLLGEVLGMDRARLLSRRDLVLPDEYAERYRALLDRRAKGECFAYIVGRKEFRGLEFRVSSSVLVPRPDTEILVEAALEAIDGAMAVRPAASRPFRILDVCTGSGCIAVALKAERPSVSVSACDLSPDALAIARANADRLLGNGMVDFFLADLLEAIRGTFDLIVSNPPYIPSAVIDTLSAETRGEPRMALDGGADGLDLIRRLIGGSCVRLESGGRLLLESGAEQTLIVAELLRAEGFQAVRTWRDLAGHERVAGGRKGS